MMSMIVLCLSSIIGLSILTFFVKARSDHLDRYGGPFLARYTDIWRYMSVRDGQHHQEIIALHRKWGRIVRTGPNSVSISDPSAIPLIYGVNRGFQKVSTQKLVVNILITIERIL